MASYALGNQLEETYMLMTLSPVVVVGHQEDGPSFQDHLRQLLTELPRAAQSPFEKIPSLHFCRFVIIGDVPCEGFPAETDHLNSPYLLMSASIAGDWKLCIQSMLQKIPKTISDIFSNCYGFPGIGDHEAVVNYLESCQIDASFSFGAYPEASLYEVRRALKVQSEFRRFAIDSQGASPRDLQSRFTRFIESLEME